MQVWILRILTCFLLLDRAVGVIQAFPVSWTTTPPGGSSSFTDRLSLRCGCCCRQVEAALCPDDDTPLQTA